jgi:putative ABC transport system ATP-binding protein
VSAFLEARDLARTYRRGPEEVRALRGATLELERSEVVALVGPSGSGKSTLLAILAGWERPDRGVVRWRGAPPPDPLRWNDVAVVPQRLGLLEELSIEENVGLPLRLEGRLDDGKRRVAELLEGFGLGELAKRGPAEVSLGEQQRAALARALIGAPTLLLADEPTGHQDAEWAIGVLRALREAAARGTCCLLATHNAETLPFADRILAIRDGVVSHDPTTGATRSSPADGTPPG